MKKLLLFAPCLLAACASTTGSTTDTAHHSMKAHDGKFTYVNPYGDDPMTNPQFMTDWMAWMTPGAEHEALVASAGDWDVSGHWFMKPGAEPIPSTGTAHIEPILGGRFIIEEFESAFMGQPFQGRMLMGFNNLTEEFFSVWVDSTTTGSMITTGKHVDANTIELRGMVQDLSTPEGRPMRITSRKVTDDHSVFSMYDTAPDGSEFLMMELVYKRK